MKTEQIMALLADLRSRINPAYATQLGTESYERRLCAEAIESLVQERDEFKTRMQRLMTTQLATSKERDALNALLQQALDERDHYVRERDAQQRAAISAMLERDELKELLKDERNRGLQLLADAKEWQQGFMREEAENKTLRDALEYVMDRLIDTHEDDIAAVKAREALKGEVK